MIKMVVDHSAISSAIASQLVRGWRERWSDVEWSVHFKALLPSKAPKQYAGDAYNLPDILLKQALIGVSPNTLLLSYYQHAAVSGIIRVYTALDTLMQYKETDKPYCLQSLLLIATDIITYVRQTGGGSEASANLGSVLLRIMHWFLCITEKCLQQLPTNSSQMTPLLNIACDGITTTWESGVTSSLIIIAKAGDEESMDEIDQLEANLRNAIAKLQNHSNYTVELQEKILTVIKTINSLRTEDVWDPSSNSVEMTGPLLDASYQPINVSINVLLTIEAVLHPTNALSAFVQEIQCVQQTQGLSDAQVFCELMRSCFMGMIQSAKKPEELKWTALTYLKLPKALQSMCTSTEQASASMYVAMEMLLRFVPLLDLVDTKCNTDCLSFFLAELSKLGILNEAQVKQLQTRRHAERQCSPKKLDQTTGAANQPSVQLIRRAELTAVSLLKTLDADFSKTQDGLLGVFSGMLAGKSFELIMTAFAAAGTLQSFAMKLIKLNEFARHSVGESPKGAQTRSLLFDISFLILCHIVWLHRSEVFLSSPETVNSSFVHWASHCLPENGQFKSDELNFTPDQSKVDLIIGQLKSGELKTSHTRWNDVVLHMPYIIREILYAWEARALTEDMVKVLMTSVRSHMCCLPVVACTWLCSHANVCEQTARSKPLQMMRWLMVAEPPQDVSLSQLYTERSHLMQQSIISLAHDFLPPSATRSPLPPTSPALEVLQESVRDIFSRGCVDVELILRLDHLLKVGGHNWFTWHLVQEMLGHERVEDLSCSVGLTYALLHLDIEGCTHALLRHTLPQLLLMNGKCEKLSDPKGKALATLCVTAINVTRSLRKTSSPGSALFRRGKKRNRSSLSDSEDDDIPAPKIARGLPDHSPTSLSTDVFASHISNFNTSKDSTSSLMSPVSTDQLTNAMGKMFSTLTSVLSTRTIGPRSSFLLSLLQLAVRSPKETSSLILNTLPSSLISNLLLTMPGEFHLSFVLKLSDLNQVQQRRVAASNVILCSRYKAQNTPAIRGS